METQEETAGRGNGQEEDPRTAYAKQVARGEPGREMLEHAAMGAELNDDEERDALDWLLGAPAPTVHDITVDYETPAGYTKLTFVVQRTDGRKIDKIEQRHISQTTGRIDRLSADCEIVVECCSALRSASGRETTIGSQEFLTVTKPDGGTFKHASPVNALEERFTNQLGLLGGVAMEIRRIAGYDPERVGGAQRRLVQASLG